MPSKSNHMLDFVYLISLGNRLGKWLRLGMDWPFGAYIHPCLITYPDSQCREPGPDDTYDKVEIADVGYMRDGHFCRLFNAALPIGHEKNTLDAPMGHIPLEPDYPPTFETHLPARRALWGSDVQVLDAKIDVSAALYVHRLVDQTLKQYL